MTGALYDWYLRGEKKEEKENHLKMLGKIAYYGFLNGKFILPHKKVKNLITKDLLETEILKQEKGKKSAYSFIHSTFQEYLTAFYISQKSFKKQEKFILENRYKPAYQPVIVFLAGLVYSVNPDRIQDFFHTLCQKSDIITISLQYQLECILRCLNECEGLLERISAIDILAKENPTLWDTKLSNGYEPFLSTAYHSQNNAFYYLASHYPNLLTQKNIKKGSASIISARRGNLQALDFLYHKNPLCISDSHYTNYWWQEGGTSLHFAAKGGHVAVMKFLLEKDPHLISQYTRNGYTSLHAACKGGDIESIEFLLKKADLLHEYMDNGYTPFHAAAQGGHLPVMKLLLQKDRTLLFKYMKNGYTSLHAASEGGHVEAMDFLMEEDDTLIFKYTNDGYTPFHAAVQGGQISAMKLLQQKDRTLIDKNTDESYMPFHSVQSKGQLETLRFSLQQDAPSTSLRPGKGRTPLWIAVEEGHFEACKYVYAEDSSQVSKSFDEHGRSLFGLAACRKSVEILNWTYQLDRSQIASCGILGDTPFHWAVQQYEIQLDILQWLHQKDSTLISKCTHLDETVLHYAVRNKYNCSQAEREDIFEWIHTTDRSLITKCTKDGNTPLHYAATKGNISAGKWLHKTHPELLNIKNHAGETALMVAEQYSSATHFAEWMKSVGGVKYEGTQKEGKCLMM